MSVSVFGGLLAWCGGGDGGGIAAAVVRVVVVVVGGGGFGGATIANVLVWLMMPVLTVDFWSELYLTLSF